MALFFFYSALYYPSLFPSEARAQSALPPTISAALKAAGIPVTHTAIVVQPVEGGPALVQHNTEQPMNPASVMKLLTTYAALDLLGPANTWRTEALSNGPLENGRLQGPLILRGSGDPKFAIEHFTALLRALRARGIRLIDGDLILDRSAFALPTGDPGAFDDKPMRPYNVLPDALLINFQALRLVIASDNVSVRVWQETPAANFVIDNQLQLSNGECASDWKDRITPRLIRDGERQRLELRGSFSNKCGEKALNLAPLSADMQIASLFRALWQEQGGSFSGQVHSGTTPANARLLAFNDSPPLAEVIRDINKFSNNVMARQLFLTLGNGEAPATAARARQRLRDWQKQRGLEFPELVIDNGSGLSRSERISAASLSRLLRHAWASPLQAEFAASLPIAGIDGTMKKRLTDSQASGRARIKTGTIDSVKTAAGYALDSRGKTYAFVFLINDPAAQRGQAAIDALLLWLAARQGEAR